MSYGALVGPGLSFAGVDQGIDFTGPGDVYVPYGAVVTRVQAGGTGWPGQGAVVNVKLLEGPAAGHYLYYAEDLSPTVKVGQKVPAGGVIARATGSGQAPGIEVGWAQASGIPLAPRPPARPASQYTPEGASFDSFIKAVTDVQTHRSGGSVAGDVAGAVNATVRHVPGVAQVEGAVGAVSSVGDFLGKLTDPHYILRGLQVIAGGALVAIGAVLLARQVALAADLPDPSGVVTKTSGVAGAAIE